MRGFRALMMVTFDVAGRRECPARRRDYARIDGSHTGKTRPARPPSILTICPGNRFRPPGRGVKMKPRRIFEHPVFVCRFRVLL